MRYLLFTALALVLLVGAASALPSEVAQTIVATASGGDLSQEAYQSAEVAGEGAVLTQGIEVSAEGTGEVAQEADNYGYADGAASVVTQGITMEATGENVYQNLLTYGNYAEVFGEGAILGQYMALAAAAEEYLYQYAQNDASTVGDGIVNNQGIAQAGAAGGEINQYAYNDASVWGIGTTTTQGIALAATSVDGWIYQDVWNDADPDAGSLADQEIALAAATGGDIDQDAYNYAYFYGDGAVAFQAVGMDADAGGYADQYGYNYADMGDYDTIMVDQSATLNAVAGTWIWQEFYNDNEYAGSNTVSDQAITMSGTAGTWIDQYMGNLFWDWGTVSDVSQVLTAAAYAGDGYAYQDAGNGIISYGDDIASQSIFLDAVATEDVTQYGYNYADSLDNLDLGQEVWLGGEGAIVYQEADNEAFFGDAVDVAQYIALTGISDDEGVVQLADNNAENMYALGGSSNMIGQAITGAATGGDYSSQYFENDCDAEYNLLAPSSYTITQDNIATLAANDEAYQELYNGIDWYAWNTGSIAWNINGFASADYVYQYHENLVEII
ncbi:MAG TPA: hypothetical protein PLK36_07955 [Methanoregulaceae archaeon]|nr:hypothetical protein [Methanoregulaceae archaeon]